MTNDVKQILKEVGIPSVAMHASGQYFTRVGYRRSKSGKRQQAFFYLGHDHRAAVAEAVRLKAEWKVLRRKGGPLTVWPLGAEIAPSPSMARMAVTEIAQAIAHFHVEATEDAIENREEQWQTPKLRVSQVKEMFLEHRRSLIGVNGDFGICQGTYNVEKGNLEYALKPLNERLLIDELGYSELERLRATIFRSVRTRTGVNYMRSLKAMLNWSDFRADIPYRHPHGIAGLFTFRKVKERDVMDFNEQIGKVKTLLSIASDRARLYIYLGLNCGYYQSDIGLLLSEEIADYGGRLCIIKKRPKTKHQNDFEAMHPLWPEVERLIRQEQAKSNRWGLAFLNHHDEPLYAVNGDKKYDAVSDVYDKVRLKAKRKGTPAMIPFKQYRKFGTSAMERLGGQQARRLYKAGTIDSGDDVYVQEAWANLTPHLDKWSAELREARVLW